MSPVWMSSRSRRGLEMFLVLAVVAPDYVRSIPSRSLTTAEEQAAAAPPLNCDALARSDAGHGHQESLDSNGLVEVSDAPSDAPSAAPLCSDRLSNARGVYTSLHAPCTIKFHSITQFQREGEEKEVDYIDYRTSNLCRDDNVIVEIKEYLENFPDECVGDFGRCYSLEHHSKYLYPFLCLPEDTLSSVDTLLNAISYAPRWELPHGTTHVSVDCTFDREVAREETKSKAQEGRKHAREERRDEIGMTLFNWALVVVFSLAFIYALSHFIVTPLVTLVTSKRDRRLRRRSSRTCRRSSTMRTSSTLNSSYSTLPLHHSEQQITLIAEDGMVIEGHLSTDSNVEGPRTLQTRSNRGDDDAENDADHSVSSSSDDSYSYETDNNNGYDDQQQLNDFDSQVPCDFDAVPIVAATILPIADAIPATVVQDGVSYS